MKLPTAKLRPLKLQKDMPAKKALKQVLPTALFASVKARSTKVAEGSSNVVKSLQSVKESKSVKIALNLLLVRPWVLLLGFWAISLVGGALALEGMLSPRRLTMDLPEAVVEPEPMRTSSLISISQSSDEIAGDATAQPVSEEVSSVAVESASGLPVLPLVGFVGACAAGCLVMSRRRAMARLSSARAKGRVRKVRTRTGTPVKAGVKKPVVKKPVVRQPVMAAVRSGAQKPGTQKSGAQKSGLQKAGIPKTVEKVAVASAAPRQKKRRQRPRKAAGVRPAAVGTSVVASRATAQRVIAKPQGGKRTTRRSMRAASRRQPMVSVVPAGEANALDWPQGSLAHQLDVRHRQAM
ncbi:MAG: hypothetical protein AAFR58_06620 [Cyanobacteria bacterium J06627_28]